MSEMEYRISVKGKKLIFSIKRGEAYLFYGEIELFSNEAMMIKDSITYDKQEAINNLRNIAKIMKIVDYEIFYWMGVIAGMDLEEKEEVCII